jgi:RNA polymerase sigma factor (sigma-70 family)
MPDPPNPEILFLEHLGWINRVAEKTCNLHGVWGPEAEDFAAAIRLKLMEDDYAIIRNHRGESSLKTFLVVVVQRKFLDHWREDRGRWRPSAMARRLGPPAPDLEALVYRDGFRLDQAGEVLRTSGRTALSDRELGELLAALPLREPRHRDVSTDEMPETAEADERADDRISRIETRALRDKVTSALKDALAQLDGDDEIILRMHLLEGHTLADVARALKIEQKPLYRRVNRLRALLRAAMEAQGVRGEDVHDLLDRTEP